jgi:hypothetical protein
MGLDAGEGFVIRTAALVILFAVLATAPARATRLEVHTDVSRATIAVQNDRFAASSPPPFVNDLPAGRYELTISSDGRRVGGYVIDVDRGITLRGARLSRTVTSAILPGAGQWRDDSWWSGAVVAGSVGLPVGFAIYYNVKAGSKRDEADVGDVPSTPGILRLEYDARALEKTRDAYLVVGGAFYVGNVLDAVVRRGAIRFRETSSGAVAATYEPSGVVQSMLLSAAWPGLGQVRQGSFGRARVWNTLLLGAGFFWAEARSQVEKAVSNRDFFEDTNSSSSPGYYEELARLESTVDEQKAVARIGAYVAVGVWAYNIIDAAFVTRGATADSGEMVRNDAEESSWTFTPGMVGESPGLVLGRKF